MLNTLNIIATILAICASILTIFNHFKKRLKHKGIIFILCLLLSSIIVWTSYVLNEKRHKEEIAKIKKIELIKDAKISSNSGYTTPVGSAGEYFGALSHIAGFYKRHIELFSHEYETYNKELAHWQEHLKSTRKSGQGVSLDDKRYLKGLVSVGRDNIYEIAKDGNSEF